MTTFSVHQWSDLSAGLQEVRRVTRGPVVILTCDPGLLQRFWLNEYAPEVIDTEARRYPSTEALADGLGDSVAVTTVPVPLDCTDGFNEAYYGRPEALLDPAARQSCSAWSFVVLSSLTSQLADPLDSSCSSSALQLDLSMATAVALSTPPTSTSQTKPSMPTAAASAHGVLRGLCCSWDLTTVNRSDVVHLQLGLLPFRTGNIALFCR
jgi:hypothetical protein